MAEGGTADSVVDRATGMVVVLAVAGFVAWWIWPSSSAPPSVSPSLPRRMAPERRPAQTRRLAGGAAPLVPSLHSSTTAWIRRGLARGRRIQPRRSAGAADPSGRCASATDPAGRSARAVDPVGSSLVADPAAWPPSRRGWWWRRRCWWCGVVSECLFYFYFLEKKFVECFLGTRQRLCRVHDKKQLAK